MEHSAAASGGSAELTQVGNDLRIVVGRIVRRLRQGHEAGELTLSELSVLSRLDLCGPLGAGELADQERISPQAMSTIVGVLAEAGVVARGTDAADARRLRLSATAAGQLLLAGRRSQSAARVARALGEVFDADELRQIAAVIPLLERLAERL
jgi:DNA-binding MarR family transcriptional regulator